MMTNPALPTCNFIDFVTYLLRSIIAHVAAILPVLLCRRLVTSNPLGKATDSVRSIEKAARWIAGNGPRGFHHNPAGEARNAIVKSHSAAQP